MNRILITGCNGFVAKYFVSYLREREPSLELAGIDLADKSVIKDLAYFSMNLMDRDAFSKLLCTYQPTHLAHFASVSSVSQSWETPVDSFTNNTNIFLNIVESVRKQEMSTRILSVGSSEQYGNLSDSEMPLREDFMLRPCNPYAVARVAQEMISKLYADSYRLNVLMTRSFNHIGPGQREIFAIPSFIAQLINAKKEKTGLISVGNVDIVRDFLDVRDVVDAYYRILFFGKSGDVYNVCSGKGTSLREIIKSISNLLDYPVTLDVDPKKIRPADNQIIIGDPTKLMKNLGWVPKVPLESSLFQMIEYLSSNSAGSPK